MNLRQVDIALDTQRSDPALVPGTLGQPISDFRVVSVGAADVTLQLGQGGNAFNPYVNFGLEDICPRETGGLWYTVPTATPGALLRLHIVIEGGGKLADI